MPFPALSLAVVGAQFANPRRKGQPTGDRQMEILLCQPGERVELRPEPTNKADQNAIAVYSDRGVQIGYVSADRTLIVQRAWEGARDVRAVFQRANAWGCAIRISFDGSEPVLPPDTGAGGAGGAGAASAAGKAGAGAAPAPVDDGWEPDPEPAGDGVDWVPEE
ncbi:MAG TPA: HIRAN domain-containing protein [Sphingomonas sp.]